MKKTDKSVIVKQNDLVESSYYLTYLQQKIMLLIISKIDNFNVENNLFDAFLTVDIKFDEIKDIIYTDKNSVSDKKIHSYVLKTLKSLKEKTIILKEKNIEKKIDNDTYTGWILKFNHQKYNSNIKVYIDPELKPYLLHIKENYTKYFLKDVISFRYTHSFRMYELIKQYENTNIKERIILLDELKQYLGIQGKYERYNQFKERVINPSINDVNKHSDLLVKYTTKRINKKPISITFYITSKEKKRDNKLDYLGIKIDKQIDEIVSKYKGYETLLDGKIDFILDRNRMDKIKHLPSYSYKCLMNETLPEIKDIPKLKKGTRVKDISLDRVFIIEEGIVIRDTNQNVLAGEGILLNLILDGKFIIVDK